MFFSPSGLPSNITVPVTGTSSGPLGPQPATKPNNKPTIAIRI
jgi:hypothetical protein